MVQGVIALAPSPALHSPTALSGKNVQQRSLRACAAASAPRATFEAPSPALVSPAAAEELKPSNMFLVKAVEALFSVPPIFAAASRQARQKIVKRAEAVGLDFEGEVAKLRGVDWEARLQTVAQPQLQMPSYYTQPFHAYPKGNLCWDAAQEFECASRSVHSPVMDPDGKACDPAGDDTFRSGFMAVAQRIMAEAGARPVQAAVDLGCATGLSSEHVRRAFPGTRVTGVDLSPHMVAVGQYLQEQRMGELDGAQPLEFLHANAEDTGLPAASTDLVTLSLVAHELPSAATAAIFREAFRLLRPGGTLAVLEMDPSSPIWKTIFKNPAAYVAFKSTEPWLLEYVTLDMPAAMQAAGFPPSCTERNTPRHKTVVAVKPQ